MGNAAAIQSVSESARRRLLLRQYNTQPDILVSRAVLLAFQRRRSLVVSPGISDRAHSQSLILPLSEIFDVLINEFGVCCTLEELPVALRQFGCKAEAAFDYDDWYSIEPIVGFIAPRKILRQVCRPSELTENEQRYLANGLTIWQAAKAGDIDTMRFICALHPDAFRSLDAFENTSLYYASLCGRERAVGFLMEQYDHANVKIPADELLRCVTNALNAHIRLLLQRKLTLKEVLVLKAKEREEEDENEGGGAWFFGEEEGEA